MCPEYTPLSVTFRSIASLFEHIRGRELVRTPLVSALYPSAGADTKPITFTHPRFLAKRRVAFEPSPNLFIYVDRCDTSKLRFQDVDTRIQTVSAEPIEHEGIAGALLVVEWESNSYEGRTCAVVRLGAENEHFAMLASSARWVPDVFIGVNDGCRMGGGNSHCVNTLDLRPGIFGADVRWWITDHFRNMRAYGELRNGDYVESRNEWFPFRFKKLALLSAEWGPYADDAMRGATLFERERR